MGYGFGGMGGFGGGKIDGVVDFPLEGLDMTRYVGSEDQKMGTDLIYDCYAVSNHMGGTGGGHYTAYAKHPISGKWNSYNDSSVHEVGRDPEDVVVSDSAYNLFYRRRDPKADAGNTNFNQIQQKANTAFLDNIDARRKETAEA